MKYSLIGYVGQGNAGDEWIHQKLRQLIQDVDASATFHTVYKSKLLSSLWGMATSDCVILGGGSLFQDQTSTKNVLYYTGLSLLALLMRKKVWHVGQGIGPLKNPLARIKRGLVKTKNLVVFP